jgi:hypothetical protein
MYQGATACLDVSGLNAGVVAATLTKPFSAEFICANWSSFAEFSVNFFYECHL